MSLIIDLDTSEYEKIESQLITGMSVTPRRILEEGSAIIQEALESNVPVRTGKLKRSIQREIGETHAIVGTSSGYGRYVDEGVGPRIIRGKPILRFELNGKIVFARSAFNPGFAGRHFKLRTIQDSYYRLREIIKDIFKQELGFR